jgi:hypothetical protein
VFKRARPVGDPRPFPIERGQPALQNRNLLSDFLRIRDVVIPFRLRINGYRDWGVVASAAPGSALF